MIFRCSASVWVVGNLIQAFCFQTHFRYYHKYIESHLLPKKQLNFSRRRISQKENIIRTRKELGIRAIRFFHFRVRFPLSDSIFRFSSSRRLFVDFLLYFNFIVVTVQEPKLIIFVHSTRQATPFVVLSMFAR